MDLMGTIDSPESMDSMEDFRKTAKKVSNWGRWGENDQMGTLNFITPEKLVEAGSLVKQGKSISLGADFGPDGFQQGVSPLRINPLHFMAIDGGDGDTYAERVSSYANSRAQSVAGWRDGDLFRFNEDYIVMPLQASTQWDALSHVYYEGFMYNGFPSDSVTSQGAAKNSICTPATAGGIASRGVLLDVARFRNVEYLEGGPLIQPQELDEVARAQGVTVGSGDIVLVRTGWQTRFHKTKDANHLGNGLSYHCVNWLSDLEVAAVAADNHAVEGFHLRESEATFLPMHLIAQRDMGLHMGELFNLDELAADCAADGVYEFLLAAPPIRFIGAVGSPLNPLALK